MRFVDEMVARRAKGEPLQYVLGRWGFRTLDLMVDRRVLIPRPETEVVAGLAIDALPTSGVLVDLGTGSGAIALSAAAERWPDVEVWATDASAEALAVARANLAGLGRRGAVVRLVEGDWFVALPHELRGHVDVLVSNPPYVAATDPLAHRGGRLGTRRRPRGRAHRARSHRGDRGGSTPTGSRRAGPSWWRSARPRARPRWRSPAPPAWRTGGSSPTSPAATVRWWPLLASDRPLGSRRMATLSGAFTRWRAKRNRPQITYAPKRNGRPDPGEVVWAWVPYEENAKQGKDRPVVVIGRAGRRLLAVPLTSQDRSGPRNARAWVAVGTGGWDRSGRASYANAARLLRYSPRTVRREGGAVPRDRFDEVVERVRLLHPTELG